MNTVEYDYDQADWGAEKLFRDDTRAAGWTPREYVIHYGGNAVTGAYAGVSREMQVLRIYEQSHLSRGWSAIAYNYAVGNSGAVYRLRGENTPGATKYHNSYTKSILWIGGGAQIPTDAAFRSMRRIIGSELVYPHSFYRNSQCPGNAWRSWIDGYTSGDDEMPRILFEGLIESLFAADGEFQPNDGAAFWINLIDDPTNWQWNAHFWPAFTRMVTAS
jgi:hypothetical protein